MAVRREAVRLELEDAFTRDMLAAAAATKLLERNLKSLDGASVDAGDSMDDASKSTKALTLEQAIAEEKTKRLNATLRDQARASVNADEGLSGVSGSTREYSIETAIADERANRLKASLREQAKAAIDAEQGLDQAAQAANRAASANDLNARSIDRYSGRLGLLLKTAAVLGPTIAPISVAAVGGIAALSSQIGFAVIGVGALVTAFQGVGDAIAAVEKARLEPTVKNLEAARDALKLISPEAQAFVERFQELRPVLKELRDSAGEGLFPGLIEGMDAFERVAPRFQEVLQGVGLAIGDLLADAGDSLTGPEWFEFIAFVRDEAPVALEAMGRALGNVVHGMAELWMAFAPINSDFNDWILEGARGFDAWASGLSRTKGFENFIQYLRDNGPLLGDALVSIANAILQIGEAAAPLGGPVLQAITNVANAIAAVADSPLGTPLLAAATAMSAISLSASVATASVTRLNAAMATLGVTSKGVGAAGTAGAAGKVAGLAALIPLGLLDTVPDYLENLEMMASGERNVAEGFGRMIAGATPVGAALNLLGVDVLGVSDAADDAAGSSNKAATALDSYHAAVEAAQRSNMRLHPHIFATNRALLQQTRDAERLKKVIAEQNQAIAESASVWGDYSQDIELGTTSLDAVMDRIRALADAAANEAENIRTALKRGMDPAVIKSLYDTLGPQGAVLALEQLAKVSKTKADEIAAPFERLSRNTGKVEGAMRAVDEAITGTRGRLRDLNGERAEPPIGADTSEFDKKHRRVKTDVAVINALLGEPTADLNTSPFDRKRKHVRTDVAVMNALLGMPTADLNDGPFRGKNRGVQRQLKVTDGTVAMPTANLNDNASGPLRGVIGLLHAADGYNAVSTITVRTIRTGSDTAGGPAPLRDGAARGGEVPDDGGPYSDRFPYMLAPRERITSDMFGQATRSRRLLDLINDGRISDRNLPGMARGGTVGEWRSRASERPVSSGSGGGGQTVIIRERMADRLTLQIDGKKFTAHVVGIARPVARDEIGQDREFRRTHGG